MEENESEEKEKMNVSNNYGSNDFDDLNDFPDDFPNSLILERDKHALVYGNPMSIFIENLTGEELENVEVFNNDYKNQNKVKYESCYSTSPYDLILRIKNAIIDLEEFKIGKIRQMTNKGKSKKESYGITDLFFEVSSLVGQHLRMPIEFKIDEKQHQKEIAEKEVVLNFDVYCNFFLKKLMPFTKIELSFFPIDEIGERKYTPVEIRLVEPTVTDKKD